MMSQENEDREVGAILLLGRANTKRKKNLKSIKKKVMKTIEEMNLEELREVVAEAQKAQKAAEERAEKAEKEIETYKNAWQYLNDQCNSLNEKISSLKTIVNLL